MRVTPVSYASICCVRSEMRTASSLGSWIASSYDEVASVCTPPSAAASAWYAMRAMLLSGSWAVSATHRGCSTKILAAQLSGSGRAVVLAHEVVPDAVGRRGTWRPPRTDRGRPTGRGTAECAKSSMAEPASQRLVDVRAPVRERDGELLHGGRCRCRGCGSRRTRSAPSAAALSLQYSTTSTREAQSGRGREDVGAPRDVLLEHVVLQHHLEIGRRMSREPRRRRRTAPRRAARSRWPSCGSGATFDEVDARRAAPPCRRGCRSARRPCRPRRAPAGGRSRARSASAGRARSRSLAARPRAASGCVRSSPCGEAAPEYWPITHSRSRYIPGQMPRVNGASPGVPMRST